MEPISFTIPVAHDSSVSFEDYSGPHFYQHLHRHVEFQLMWIIKGTGTFIVDHNMYRFKANDMFLIGPNQPHVFKSDSEYFKLDSKKEVKGLAVFFNPYGILGPLFDLPELESTKQFLEESRGGFQLPVNRIKYLSSKLIALRETSAAGRIAAFLSLINDLYTYRNEYTQLSEKRKAEPYPEAKTNRIKNIYDYLLKNYENDITLEEVAEKAFLTPPAFCRYFKKHTGKTFIAFLNELRINEACKRLVTDTKEHQIANIAHDCGFNSVTNFNRVFKTIKGSSPSDYQKEFLARISL